MKAKSNFRTVVKHSYLSVGGTAKAKAKAHVNYVAFRPGKDKDHQSRLFFDAESDTIKPGEVKKRIESFRHKGVLIHKLILSPGEDSVDMKEFTRSVMKKLGQQKGGNLEYWAVVHDNTDHQHAHIIVAGKDKEGHRVRLHLKDADFVREAGDKIAEKLKETELIPEPQISAPSKLHQFFMKIGLRVKQAQSKDQNKEKGTVGNDQREISLIGEPVSNVQKQKRLESEAKRQKRKLAKHNTIITVHRTFVPDAYRARTPKEELL